MNRRAFACLSLAAPSGTCTPERPGSACDPRRHAPGCRYAGSEPKMLVLTERQWRLVRALSR